MKKTIPFYAFMVSVSILIVVLGLYHAQVNPLLEYQRSAVANGQWWRLLSGHWVHLNMTHMALNLAGLWLVAFWVGKERRFSAWLVAGAGIAIAITASLYVWQPTVSYYVGLSGLLHGLLIFGLAPLCAQNNPVGWASVAAVFIKIGCEQLIPAGHTMTAELIAGPVVDIAHIYGALAGALLAVCWPVIRRAWILLNGKLLNGKKA